MIPDRAEWMLDTSSSTLQLLRPSLSTGREYVQRNRVQRLERGELRGPGPERSEPRAQMPFDEGAFPDGPKVPCPDPEWQRIRAARQQGVARRERRFPESGHPPAPGQLGKRLPIHAVRDERDIDEVKRSSQRQGMPGVTGEDQRMVDRIRKPNCGSWTRPAASAQLTERRRRAPIHPRCARVDLDLEGLTSGELERLQVVMTIEEAFLEAGDSPKARGEELALRTHGIGREEIEVSERAQRAIWIVTGRRDALQHDDVLVDDLRDRSQDLVGNVHLPDGEQFLPRELVGDLARSRTPEAGGDEVETVTVEIRERAGPVNQDADRVPDLGLLEYVSGRPGVAPEHERRAYPHMCQQSQLSA